MADNDKYMVVPRFFTTAVENKVKSKQQGRPIYENSEFVEVRFPGDRTKVSVFPAHVICGEMQDEEGDTRKITYAERWPDQYRRFKNKQHQVAEGTPIDELPFLDQAKRSELKALSIYTAEALAALDSQPLRNLGQGGRDLKNKAQAYLDAANGTANIVAMAEENAELKRQLAELQADKSQAAGNSQFDAWQDDQIKDWIEEQIGERPRGNPSHATLVKRADEIAHSLAETEAA